VGRRALSFADRADIAVGILAGRTDRQIGADLGRDHMIIWRERQRNSTQTRGYRPVSADCAAERKRKCPQSRKIDTDPVLAALVRQDLARSRMPGQIARRLRLEATDVSVETMTKSPDAQGRTVSHEALHRWIYARPKGELAKSGILLQSKRTKRRSVKPLGERTGGRIIGMVSIDDRPEEAADRRVPGAWEGDLVVGKGGKSAVGTLVERHSRFLIMPGLPEGKKADGLADVLIDRVNDLPALMRGSLSWDQGMEMARHAQLTVATDLPVYFAHPHSPWERPSNENTNGLMEWTPTVGRAATAL
jgi:transposase, IS30 family